MYHLETPSTRVAGSRDIWNPADRCHRTTLQAVARWRRLSARLSCWSNSGSTHSRRTDGDSNTFGGRAGPPSHLGTEALAPLVPPCRRACTCSSRHTTHILACLCICTGPESSTYERRHSTQASQVQLQVERVDNQGVGEAEREARTPDSSLRICWGSEGPRKLDHHTSER